MLVSLPQVGASIADDDARRRAGLRLSAWLEEAEPLISQADVRQVAALAAELAGRRLAGARR